MCKGEYTFRDECYIVGKRPVGWDKASEECVKDGGQLVIPEKAPVVNYFNRSLTTYVPSMF